MLGLWLESGRIGLRRDLGRPEPGPGEALLRLRLAGVCSTDLELVRGYYPFRGILGHEFVADVVSSPDDPAWEGRRVVGEINAACSECRSSCRQGPTRHCPQRTVLGIVNRDGCFAEYLTLPIANLLEVPESLEDQAAVFTEPLAAALQITQQVQIQPDSRVLVIGAGRLGQLIARVLALTGCRLCVSVRHAGQRERLERLGIECLQSDEIAAASMDVVIDAAGSPCGLDDALKAVRPCGAVVLKSTYASRHSIDFSRVVVDEVRLIGSRCGPFAPALRLMESARIDPRDLIQDRVSMDSAPSALERARQPGYLKALIAPG